MILEIMRVEGMQSERDRRVVLGAIERLPGLGRIISNLADGTLRLERAESLQLATLVAAIERAGYRVSVLA